MNQQDAPGSGKAIASFVLGILGLVAWCLPLVGFPITVIGLILGIQGRHSKDRRAAIAGIVLCSIGLGFTTINAAYGAYLGATGQHRLFQPRDP